MPDLAYHVLAEEVVSATAPIRLKPVQRTNGQRTRFKVLYAKSSQDPRTLRNGGTLVEPQASSTRIKGLTAWSD